MAIRSGAIFWRIALSVCPFLVFVFLKHTHIHCRGGRQKTNNGIEFHPSDSPISIWRRKVFPKAKKRETFSLVLYFVCAPTPGVKQMEGNERLGEQDWVRNLGGRFYGNGEHILKANWRHDHDPSV